MRWLDPSKSVLLLPALLLAAGCSSGPVAAHSGTEGFAIASATLAIDTNCSGCSGSSSKGAPVLQFSAITANDELAPIHWTLSGGDPVSGAGHINAAGQYTPPSFLTRDSVSVQVTANRNGEEATAQLTVTPGFLEPLTPENAALGANGQLTITGYLSETGGKQEISFSLVNPAGGSTASLGTLGTTTCQRDTRIFTHCTTTYTAPSLIAAATPVWVVATAGGSGTSQHAVLLLNSAGINSNPASHQALQTAQTLLGSSGGNNSHYDAKGGQAVDCCGGTLGSLVQDGIGRQFLLGNNHVLARSDQATVGDAIVQPGLIDNNCTPFGDGPGTTPVASLSGWLPLNAATTNADAALAQVGSGTVSANGSILELGARLPDGTLAAAPPGVSSTGGKGESATLGLTVAKSGRTTGLTCGGITALAVDVTVDYFADCAETHPYLTKTFTNQIALSGNQFSDAGDSGALVVDAGNAEPVGLLFAGGIDLSGVSQAVANPVPDLLSELGAQLGGGGSIRFVGGPDHGVSCLNYGDATVADAQSRLLTDQESARSEQALTQARTLVNPSRGILGVAIGKSSDHPGEAAILVYTDETVNVAVSPTIDGVRTVAIPTHARAVALGSAPLTAAETAPAPLPAATLNAALAIKQGVAPRLMRQNPGFFAVGVGQSLDNPKEPALVVYVDRNKIPAQLPATVEGLRTRYILMDRLHVTRSYAAPTRPQGLCPRRGGDWNPHRGLDLQ